MTKRIDRELLKLKGEIAYFNEHKKELLSKDEGKFVLIKGRSRTGCSFPNEAKAYEKGLERFGNTPFLIKKVTQEEETDKMPALVSGLINVNL